MFFGQDVVWTHLARERLPSAVGLSPLVFSKRGAGDSGGTTKHTINVYTQHSI
jgi:hypothetical protein